MDFRCLPPHSPLSTTPCPAVYHPMLRCLPPHAPLSTTPCPAVYHPMPRGLPLHAPLPTASCAMLGFCPAHSAPHTHIWRSKGGARCSVAAVKTRRRRARTLRRCCGLFRLRFVSSLFPLAIFWSFVVFGKTDRDVVTGETNFSRQGGDRRNELFPARW